MESLARKAPSEDASRGAEVSDIFSLQLAAFAKKAGANADLVVRKVVLGVGKSVVEKSPVDTGRFRANWQHSVGEIDDSTSENVDPSGSAAVAGIAASIDEQPASGVVHYLTNSLPYAIPLENGHSKQAPQGMTHLTVVEYQRFVDEAVAGLSK